MTNFPLFSIVIPVYNEALYIRQCLDSILDQNKGDVEICISNNASTDETWEIICEYSAKHDCIKSVNQSIAIHPLDNYIQAFQLATGKFAYPLGGDDYLLPGIFEEARQHLPHSDLEVISNFAYLIPKMNYFSDKTGEIIGTLPPLTFDSLFGVTQGRKNILKFLLNNANHDELFLAFQDRITALSWLSIVPKNTISPPSFLLQMSTFLQLRTLKKVYITEQVFLMKRYDKPSHQYINKYSSLWAAKNPIVSTISRLVGELYFFTRLFREKVISLDMFILLCISPRKRSLSGETLHYGPLIYIPALLFSKVKRLLKPS